MQKLFEFDEHIGAWRVLVQTRDIQSGAVSTRCLADEAVTEDKLADGSVTGIKIGTGAVTEDKIADGAIDSIHIKSNTVSGEKLADEAIESRHIKDNSIGAEKIKDGTIENVDIKDGTLDGSKIKDGTIEGAKMADNAIESRHLIDNSIPGSKIKDGTIENVDIKDGTLDGSKIKDNTIQGGKLADGAISNSKIVDGSVTESKIGTGAVTESKVGTGAVTESKIGTGAVTENKISDGAVTENKLAPGAVTTDKLSDGVISELQTITDAVPTASSVKPVQSGGTLDSIIKHGSAFDLSAYNSGTTYADLTAALTALNSLPSTFKKGGMSFKYVQTSDNNYVQYFLTKNEWSANVADWEKMNLEKEVNQLGQDVKGSVILDESISVSDSIVNLIYDRHIKEGSTVIFSVENAKTTAIALAFRDANNEMVQDMGNVPIENFPLSVVADADAEKIRVAIWNPSWITSTGSFNISVRVVGDIEKINDSISDINDSISDIADNLEEINKNYILANPLLLVGRYIDPANGNLINAGFMQFTSSNLIPLLFYDDFNLKNILPRTDVAFAAIYDKDKQFIHSFVYSSETDVTLVVSNILSNYQSAFYIRFCGSSGSQYPLTTINSQFSTYSNIEKCLQNINSLNENVSEIKDEIRVFQFFDNIISQNLVPISASAGYQNNTGAISGEGTDMNWFHTEFIPVKNGSTIKCQNLGGQGTSVMTIGFFDVNKQCLVSESYINSIGEFPVTLTVSNSNIAYVRFSGTYNRWFGSANEIGKISMELPIAINTKLDDNIRVLSNEIAEIKENLPSDLDESGIVSDIEHIICYGQSLSQGDWEDHIVSRTQKYNSLMFTGTIRVWEYRDQEHRYDALIPAVETFFEYQEGETVVGAPKRAETPCCGTAEKAMELMISNGFNINNYQYQLLLSAPGRGGLSIAALDKGTDIYARLLADVQAGKNLANASGKSFVCRGVLWIQGENDNAATFDWYYNRMDKLFNDLNNDIRAITGQKERVHFFLYQTRCYDFYLGYHYPNIPLAQLAICKNRTDCHLVGPIYQMPLISDYTHLTAEGSKWYGGYCGKVWKKVIMDGERWIGGIYLKNYKVIGNVIELQFNVPNPPLTFDTTNVPDRGISKGFQIRELNDFDQNSYLDIISNVEIIRPDTVKITCTQSPSGKRLTYAINGTATQANPQDTGSGNLRDSCTDVFSFPIVENGVDVSHSLYNWCPLFDQLLN